MKCSVYIATPDGGVDWLHTSGNIDADMGNEDMGFQAFMNSVDCLIMGRKCMDMIASMNLSSEQWPYGNKRIVVLSHTVKEPPESLQGRVNMYSGSIPDLMLALENEGFKHAYIDGGSTITSFINLKLIDQMIITQAPILLGEGISLFGKVKHRPKLENAKTKAFINDFVQVKYNVNYS